MTDELKPIPGFAFPHSDLLRQIEEIREGRGRVVVGDGSIVCQACADGQHWDCGMQTWCECDCPGPDGDYQFPEEDVP